MKLGRTGLELPDIGFGSSSLSGDDALVAHALSRGITYFDTAESYQGGSSEETIGRALAGRRDEVLLASKQSASADAKRAELFETLEGSLRRLRTDRIDVYFNHAVNDPARLRNPEWPEFTSRAKQQGKIRFTGMSGHGGRLVECLDLAVDQKLVDVVLVAFNFGQDPAFYEKFTGSFDFVARQPELPRVLAKARAAGRRRGRDEDAARRAPQRHAPVRRRRRHLRAGRLPLDLRDRPRRRARRHDEEPGRRWTSTSAPRAGRGRTPADAALLRRYARRTERTQCRYGCSDCASACPAGVSIPDVLRARMYAFDYEEPSLARAALAEAGGAAACLSCGGTPCATRVPARRRDPGADEADQRGSGAELLVGRQRVRDQVVAERRAQPDVAARRDDEELRPVRAQLVGDRARRGGPPAAGRSRDARRCRHGGRAAPDASCRRGRRGRSRSRARGRRRRSPGRREPCWSRPTTRSCRARGRRRRGGSTAARCTGCRRARAACDRRAGAGDSASPVPRPVRRTTTTLRNEAPRSGHTSSPPPVARSATARGGSRARGSAPARRAAAGPGPTRLPTSWRRRRRRDRRSSRSRSAA